MSRRGILFVVLVAVSLSGCDGGLPVSPGPGQGGAPTFTLAASHTLGSRPGGISVAPGGQSIIVAMYGGPVFEEGVFHLDAATFQERAVATGYNHWGVTFNPSGAFAMIGARFGNRLLQAGSLEEVARLGVRSTFAVTDRAGSAWWVVGNCFDCDVESGAYRLTPGGEILQAFSFSTPDNSAFALSSDEQLLVAAAYPSVHVLRSSDLALVRSFDFGDAFSEYWTPDALVPLDAPGRALLIGSSSVSWDAPDVFILPVDYYRGTVEAPITVSTTGRSTFGHGNPWARVGDWIVIVSGQTFLVLDGETGALAARYEDLFPEAPAECCNVAYDATRHRLLVAGEFQTEDPFLLGGRVFLYEIHDP